MSGDKNEILFKRFGINYSTLPEQFRRGSTIVRREIINVRHTPSVWSTTDHPSSRTTSTSLPRPYQPTHGTPATRSLDTNKRRNLVRWRRTMGRMARSRSCMWIWSGMGSGRSGRGCCSRVEVRSRGRTCRGKYVACRSWINSFLLLVNICNPGGRDE